MALYFDNANFRAFHNGLRLNKATGKSYVFCAWCFPNDDKIRQLLSAQHSTAEQKWSCRKVTTHKTPASLRLEPTDQHMLDCTQIKRVASIIEVYRLASVDESDALPTELPERSPQMPELHTECIVSGLFGVLRCRSCWLK